MSNLARVNFLAQQRLDLPHLKAMQSYATNDARALAVFLAGFGRPLVVRGLEVVSKSGLSLTVRLANAVVVAPSNAVCPLYVAPAGIADAVVQLDQNATVYVEAYFYRETVSGSEVTSGFWDEVAPNINGGLGTEFIQSVRSQEVVRVGVRTSLTGFSTDGVPITIAQTSTGVDDLEDARFTFFRLGVPSNQSSTYDWSTVRQDSPVSGPGTGNDADSSFRAFDASGSLNDKALFSIKDAFDALATRILELSGASRWFLPSSVSGFVNNLNLNIAYFDSDAGHSVVSSSLTQLMWSRPNGSGVPDLLLRSVAAVSGQPAVEWQATYGTVRWGLGGAFTSGTRAYATSDFVLPASPDDGYNVYLALEREVVKGSGNSVTWYPSTGALFTANQTIQGVTGDFAGIAIGDYVRKESEGISRYYRVTAAHDGVAPVSTVGFILDATYVQLQVETAIPASSVESLRFFRSRYSQADLVVETPAGRALNQYADTKYYWIGRRDGVNFELRRYGTLEPGEQVDIGADSEQDLRVHDNELRVLSTDNSLIFNDATGRLTRGGAGVLFQLMLRSEPNRVPTGGTQNRAAARFNIDVSSIPGYVSMSDGDELWVRLNETPSASAYTVSSGTIASGTLNVWEVLSPTASPLANYQNRNVYLVGKRVGTFFYLVDGSVFGMYGRRTNALQWLGNLIFSTDRFYEQSGGYTYLGNGSVFPALPAGLFVDGNLGSRTRAVAVSDSFLQSDNVLLVDSTTGAVTITLPATSAVADGFGGIIKDAGGQAEINQISVVASDGSLIDDLSTYPIDAEYESVRFVKRGTKYYIL